MNKSSEEAGQSYPLKLYTVEEAAQVLRIGRWKLYDLIRRGRIKTIKIGRRRFVEAGAIAELISQLSEEVD